MIEEILQEYKNFTGKEADYFERIISGVSKKIILRIFKNGKSIIGIFNDNIKENFAFFSFTKTFSESSLPVSKILYISANNYFYFVSDLGKQTLYDYILSKPHRFTLFNIYKNALDDLLNFQITGKHYIDFNKCFETKVFDSKQINFDFSRFKNYYLIRFLKNHYPHNLYDAYKYLTDKVSNYRNDYFMYRDFQPRNIIKNKNNLYYVDYQAGRMGPLQYDLISFLYSGSIDVTSTERKELIRYYIKKLKKVLITDSNKFIDSLNYFALLRLFQILGSYCYSYYVNDNKDILKKIPRAMENLQSLDFDEKIMTDFKNELYAIHISMHR